MCCVRRSTLRISLFQRVLYSYILLDEILLIKYLLMRLANNLYISNIIIQRERNNLNCLLLFEKNIFIIISLAYQQHSFIEICRFELFCKIVKLSSEIYCEHKMVEPGFLWANFF